MLERVHAGAYRVLARLRTVYMSCDLHAVLPGDVDDRGNFILRHLRRTGLRPKREYRTRRDLDATGPRPGRPERGP